MSLHSDTLTQFWNNQSLLLFFNAAWQAEKQTKDDKIDTCCFSAYRAVLKSKKRFGCVMVSVLASNAVDRGFESWLGQTKDDKIDTRCFSAYRAVLKSKKRIGCAMVSVLASCAVDRGFEP